MKAIIYLRVSTEEQAERGFSIQAQREECSKRAAELGCDKDSIIEYSDEGISGSILERPSLMAAMNLVKNDSDIRYFICLDSSRLSRSVAHQLIIVDEIKKSNVQLVFIKTSYDDTPEGRFQLTVMSAVDEYERARMRFRSELGKTAKANKKLLTHSPGLYGYDFNKEDDTLSINPEEAKNVRLMYEWVANEDIGPRAVALKLNDLGVPSKKNKLWQKTTVKRILCNTAYKGTLYIRKFDTTDVKLNKFKEPEDKVKRKLRPAEEWIGVSVPPIIDEDLWSRVQDQMTNARRKWRSYSKTDYLLSALCRCGICGSTLHGNLVSSRNNKYRYYVCTARSPGIIGMDKCSLPSINADMLEELVWRKVVLWLNSPEELEKELRDGFPSNIEDKEKRLAELEIELEILVKEKERVATMYQKGLIDEISAEKRLKEINGKSNNIKLINQTLHNEINRIKISNRELDIVKEVSSKLLKMIDKMKFDDKQIIIKSLIEEVVITNDDIVIKAKIPEMILKLDFL